MVPSTNKSKMNKLSKQMSDSIKDRAILHQLAKTNTSEHKIVFSKLDEFGKLLCSMNTIELNGNKKIYTQSSAFQEIYNNIKELKNITTGIRVKKKLKESIKEWKANTTLGNFLLTAVGKALYYTIILFIALSVLKVCGLNALDPIALAVMIFRATIGRL
jgi:hypothetical protein